VRTTGLQAGNASPLSPEAGIYKAHKNLKSLNGVHGIYFKETPARKQILQICRLKAAFSAAVGSCTPRSSRSGYFQTQRSGWQKHLVIFTPRGTQPWVTSSTSHIMELLCWPPPCKPQPCTGLLRPVQQPRATEQTQSGQEGGLVGWAAPHQMGTRPFTLPS